MKWQPIETAPTDGTRILLRGRNGKIADGHYGQPDGFANPKRFVWPYINATPTHWAPLALIAAAAELLAAAMKVNALSIQTDAHKELRAAIANATGDDDAAPECTCAAKDMTFGRCCKVTPNAALMGGAGFDRSPKWRTAGLCGISGLCDQEGSMSLEEAAKMAHALLRVRSDTESRAVCEALRAALEEASVVNQQLTTEAEKRRKPCTCHDTSRGPGRPCAVKAGTKLGKLWQCVEEPRRELSEEVEAVIACLEDDAAMLRDQIADSEVAANMEKAAKLLRAAGGERG
jgi:Arc/MetJ family transcription regulator